MITVATLPRPSDRKRERACVRAVRRRATSIASNSRASTFESPTMSDDEMRDANFAEELARLQRDLRAICARSGVRGGQKPVACREGVSLRDCACEGVRARIVSPCGRKA